jgi:hypothetical protein
LTTTTVVSIALRAALLAACAAGVWRSVFHPKEEPGQAGGIWYYTIQSNLWVMLLTAVYLALSVAALCTGFASVFPRVLEIARFAVLTGITLTFLVFWLVLAPKINKDYLKTLNNLLVHTLVPILFITDFILFDRIGRLSASEVLWCMAIPLYYSVLTFLHTKINPNLNFAEGSRYPYYFMDADTLGWFRVGRSPGVFWWMLLNLGLTLGLGYLYRFLLSVL